MFLILADQAEEYAEREQMSGDDWGEWTGSTAGTDTPALDPSLAELASMAMLLE